MSETFQLSRRHALSMMALAVCAPGKALADAAPQPTLRAAAHSPRFLCNAVALTSHKAMFLGLPRWPGMESTPSVVRVGPEGALQPFPGGAWNEWAPGKDPLNAFVMVNGLHIFADDSLWVVDQGTADRAATLPGAQKLVQIDTTGGQILKVLRFGPDILPEGAQMNDLRISGDLLYITDSGLGALIVHDLRSGHTIRRLSRHPLTMHTPNRPLINHDRKLFEDASGKRPTVHADMLEVTADGRWLYFCTPTGPIRRVPTAALRDESLDDAALARKVELVAQIPTIMGTAIDTLGNLYYTDTEARRIMVLTPSGQKLQLLKDERLVNGDAMFITADRQIYVPCAQTERLAVFNRGVDALRPPWTIMAFSLPRSLQGHRLGDAVTH